MIKQGMNAIMETKWTCDIVTDALNPMPLHSRIYSWKKWYCNTCNKQVTNYSSKGSPPHMREHFISVPPCILIRQDTFLKINASSLNSFISILPILRPGKSLSQSSFAERWRLLWWLEFSLWVWIWFDLIWICLWCTFVQIIQI